MGGLLWGGLVTGCGGPRQVTPAAPTPAAAGGTVTAAVSDKPATSNRSSTTSTTSATSVGPTTPTASSPPKSNQLPGRGTTGAAPEDCECASLEDVVPGDGTTDDPTRDGWSSEVLGNQVGTQLKHLGEMLVSDREPTLQECADLVMPEFRGTPLRPAARQLHFEDRQFQVFRYAASTQAEGAPATPAATLVGPPGMLDGVRELRQLCQGGHDIRHKFKVVRIERDQGSSGETTVLLELGGRQADGARQQHAEWRCRWNAADPQQPPRLVSLEVTHYEEVVLKSALGTVFRECTPHLMRDVPSYQSQFYWDSQYWTNHVERRLGSDLLGFHGLALGDINQDGLDDVYICAPGGLPNRLYVQQEDGTLRDHSVTSRVNFYDSTRSALMLDLDNDGDQDLALATITGLLFLENDGQGVFALRGRIDAAAKAYSLAAADYDRDGFVDVYACLYHPPSSDPIGNPVPYHDANNGSPNVMVRNLGDWKFREVTREVGLDQNNRRWSYAAAWEDYDNDGDMDLYVANDFGRNNLYRNQEGQFRDVAQAAGVEDIASGMSVGWGDYDHDGWMDIYVSNMFSAAGGRVAYQRSFKSETNEQTRGYIQRLARGNTLFRNRGDGTFEDTSMSAGVNMARWAWSAPFCDWNNDGWSDLVVTNGHFTGVDVHDL